MHGHMKMLGVPCDWDTKRNFLLSFGSVVLHYLLFVSMSVFWFIVPIFSWKVRGTHHWRPTSIRFSTQNFKDTRESFQVFFHCRSTHVLCLDKFLLTDSLITLRRFSATLSELTPPGQTFVAFTHTPTGSTQYFTPCFSTVKVINKTSIELIYYLLGKRPTQQLISYANEGLEFAF